MKYLVYLALFFSVAVSLIIMRNKVIEDVTTTQNTILPTSKNEVSELLDPAYIKENVLSQDGSFQDNQNQFIFNNYKGATPENLPQIASLPTLPAVLGDSTEQKKIIVDLKNQRVHAYTGDRIDYSFLVSTGKWGATPTGKYTIWYKVRSQTMKGGDKEKGTYYYLPNVQWVRYFNGAIGFHSAYWHNNFGHPMSHGCVNMRTEDAKALYEWASPVMPVGKKILRPSPENPGTVVEVVKEWYI